MPKRCVPCLGSDIKQAILEGVRDPRVALILESIPDCPDRTGIDFCGKKARKRSAYQEFTSTCLRDKHLTRFDPTALKDCAQQWRQRKKT